MSIIDLFRRTPKEQPQEISKKSYSLANSSFVSFLQAGSNWDLSFAALIDYYSSCAPFADAIDIIANAMADIEPVVKDSLTGEVINNHPVLELLAYPNDEMSCSDFMRHLSSMYLITGNPLLEIIGNTSKPPIALDVISPTTVDMEPDRIGDLAMIRVQTEYGSAVYRGETQKGRRRFFASDMLEVWRIFSFNPNRGSRIFWGVPIARPLYYEIEQYIAAGKHNKSLLTNGARPGGTFSVKGEIPLTEDQFRRMEEQILKYYVGENNAGRPLLLENTEYMEHIVNNRDMDYKSLHENATTAIYKRFKIPLPMVNPGSQTYSNYEAAQVALFDAAVLPLARFIFQQLSSALMVRYGDDWRRYKITYQEEQISALQLRRSEYLKTKKDVGVSTVNELRADLGEYPLDGGDVILRPANEIPALESEQPPQTGEPATMDDTEKALRSAKDRHGNARYSDEQIAALMHRV